MPSFDDDPVCANCGNERARLGEAFCSTCLEDVGYPACPRCFVWMEATGVFMGGRALLLCARCNNLIWV